MQQAKRSLVVAAEQKQADAELRANNRAAKKKRDAAREKVRGRSKIGEIRQRTKIALLSQSRIRLAKRRIAASEKDVMSR